MFSLADGARVGVARAQLALRRARVEPIPNVQLRAESGYNFESRDDVYGVEVGFRVPIFDRNQGTIAQAQAELSRAQAEVARVELAPIRASLQAGSIPVIASLGETAGGQIVNINADYAANALVRELQPDKIVFLTGTGGLLDEHGKVIDSINLSTDYERLLAAPWVNGGMRVKLEQIKSLLDSVPLSSSASITRPGELAKELFTHKGSGTLVRRGERVLRVESWDQLDTAKLRALIESAFGRRLLPDYFDKTPLLRAYVSENYRAAVILTGDGPQPYLDKFAVLDDAQGEGLGRAVWEMMRAETPVLYWRSRRYNPVNAFYDAEADGSYRRMPWKAYWYGLEDFDAIRACVEDALARPASLEEVA